jgi:hypothetical protein
MIRASVADEGQVPAQLDRQGALIRKAFRDGIGALALRLQRMVREDKLSGQVLHRRSGALQASIVHSVADEGGRTVATVSTSLFYGVGWELGWPGRKSLASAKGKFSLASAATFRNGTPKKRSFLASALRDLKGSGLIQSEIDAAIARAGK